MQRSWLAVALVVTFGSLLVPSSPAEACGLAPAFARIHAALATVAGECTGDAVTNPDGDLVQPTGAGLLVRRNGWNWATFTDGVTTWIDGPCGVVSRPNEDFFRWEYGQAPCGLGEVAEPRLQPVAHVAQGAAPSAGFVAAPQPAAGAGSSTIGTTTAPQAVSCPYPLPYDLQGSDSQDSRTFCLPGGAYRLGFESIWAGPYDLPCYIRLKPAPGSDVTGLVILADITVHQGMNWQGEAVANSVPGGDYYLAVAGCNSWSAHVTG